MSKPKVRMEMRALKCYLTTEEIDAKSAELARVVMDEKNAEEMLEAAVERHKSEKKELEGVVKELLTTGNRLAAEITSRCTTRDVPCDWHFDLEGGRAILVRRDTGEAVKSREMTDEERQLKIGEALESATAEQIRMWETQLQEKSEPQQPEEEK